MVFVVSHHQLHTVYVFERFTVLVEVIEVSAQFAAAEYTDRSRESFGIVTGVL